MRADLWCEGAVYLFICYGGTRQFRARLSATRRTGRGEKHPVLTHGPTASKIGSDKVREKGGEFDGTIPTYLISNFHYWK